MNSTLTAAEEHLVAAFRSQFQRVLQGSDLNRDGTIDPNELMNILVRARTPYAVAQQMVMDIFAVLDKNGDGRISAADIMG